MPYDDPDETDPMMLVGVELEADADTWLETATVFAEEFARMGYSEPKLLELFQSPFYAGPYRAYTALGEEKVRALIHDAVQFWGAVRFREEERDSDLPQLRLLPVINNAGKGK